MIIFGKEISDRSLNMSSIQVILWQAAITFRCNEIGNKRYGIHFPQEPAGSAHRAGFRASVNLGFQSAVQRAV